MTAAAPTFTIAALAEAVGLGIPTIHHYLQAGLLPAPRRRGPATTYTEEHLLRLRALRKMRAGGLGLAEIKARLPTMSLDAVRALVDPPPAAPEPPPSDGALERWDRATLVPGLELMVRADAGPLVQRLAREIVAAYRAT